MDKRARSLRADTQAGTAKQRSKRKLRLRKEEDRGTKKQKASRINNSSSSKTSNNKSKTSSRVRASNNKKTNSNSNRKIGSHKTNLGMAKIKRKRRTINPRQRTSRKKVRNNSLARAPLLRRALISSRAISLHHRRANRRVSNHPARAKENTKRLRRHRVKVKVRTRHSPLLRGNRRRKNSPVRSRGLPRTNLKNHQTKVYRLPRPRRKKKVR